MNITKKQKQAFWVCLAVVVSAYLYHSVVISVQRYAYYQRQQRIAQARQQAKIRAAAKTNNAPPPVNAKPPSSPVGSKKPVPAVVISRSKLNGVWMGRTALQGSGLCGLKLELREKAPGTFAGYSSLTCSSVAPLMSAKDRGNARTALINSIDPDSAILSGTLQDGAIRFKVEKTIGTDINGCVITAFTATPFGSGIAAEWESGTCQGGHVVLMKVHP